MMKAARGLTMVLVVLLGAAGANGCRDTEENEQQTVAGWKATLDLDIRFEAQVQLSGTEDEPQLRVKLPASTGLNMPQDGLVAKGRIEKFPEAAMTMFAARYGTTDTASGPCGGGPVSLALSLVQRQGSTRLEGSLTAYCGKDKWYGVPARVWRLSGYLPGEGGDDG